MVFEDLPQHRGGGRETRTVFKLEEHSLWEFHFGKCLKVNTKVRIGIEFDMPRNDMDGIEVVKKMGSS